MSSSLTVLTSFRTNPLILNYAKSYIPNKDSFKFNVVDLPKDVSDVDYDIRMCNENGRTFEKVYLKETSLPKKECYLVE